jgi:tripartite-type tricarboxylate transporter receptor subunit TctC
MNIRTIADNANSQQKKYTFALEMKQGAGGAIAAQFVLNNPNNTLISNSNTHIIRPLTSTDGAYDLDSFVPVLIQGIDVPVIMVSKKYQSMSELLAKPNLNIGISAAGGITEYAARMMANKPDTQYVAFKTGFAEQIASLMGGHIDGAVVTLDSSKRFIDDGSVLRLSDSSLTVNWAMYASSKMDTERMKEIQTILTVASNQDNVRKILIDANPKYVYLNMVQLRDWYTSERNKWTKIVAQYPIK